MDGLKCKEDIRLYEKHKVFSHVAALAGSAMLEPRAKVRLGVMFKRFANTRKMLLAGLCTDRREGGGGGGWVLCSRDLLTQGKCC